MKVHSDTEGVAVDARVARLEGRNATLEAALRLVRKALRPNEIALSLNHPAIDKATMERTLPYLLVREIDAALSDTGEGPWPHRNIEMVRRGWLPPEVAKLARNFIEKRQYNATLAALEGK